MLLDLLHVGGELPLKCSLCGLDEGTFAQDAFETDQSNPTKKPLHSMLNSWVVLAFWGTHHPAPILHGHQMNVCCSTLNHEDLHVITDMPVISSF